MPSDLMTLNALACELNDTLSGGRVDKVNQPEKDEIRLLIRQRGANHTLTISASPQAPRCHITTSAKPNPLQAPAFCMLLRKYILGSQLESVSIHDNDRIMRLKFQCRNELRDQIELHLYVEIMNRYSNVILTDGNDTVMDAVKLIPYDIERDFAVVRGRKYQHISQNKLSIFEDCSGVLRSFSGGNLAAFISQNISGLAKNSIAELLFRANLQSEIDSNLTEAQIEVLSAAIKQFADIYHTDEFHPCLLCGKDAAATEYAAANGNAVRCSSLSEAFDSLYTVCDDANRLAQHTKKIRTATKHMLERLRKRIEINKSKLTECENAEEYRICGELLVANHYAITRGATEITVDNYYDGSKKKIKLDEKLSPSQNSKAYFNKYAKLKRAKSFLTQQLETDENLLDYVLSIQSEIERVTLTDKTAEIEKELYAIGALKDTTKSYSAKGARREQSVPPAEYQLDGFRILKGRNNIQNDVLTFKVAKSTDVWLHAKALHGAHVIILCEGKTPSETVVQTAAEIAASDFTQKVEIDYTERKNVRRNPSGLPAQVTYQNYSTISVTGNPHDELSVH